MKTLIVLLVATLFAKNVVAQDNCLVVADMAKDIANIRDMGIPLSAVEARLIQGVSDERERALGIVVANIVYSVKYKGEDLKREVVKRCKSKNF